MILNITPMFSESKDTLELLKGGRWEILNPQGQASGRHETSFVKFKDKFYLIGGRGILPVDVYNPKTNRWVKKNKTPIEFNHFQAVAYKDTIFIIGAMNGKYPVEKPIANIWKYVPEKDQWIKGNKIPLEHQRGGAGCVFYEGKFYIICGIEFGHTSGTNNNFSSYDPKTGQWTALTKAPHIRDHFSAIVYKDKLYCIGGRNSSLHYKDNFNIYFSATENAVDVYDFKTGKWSTMEEKLPFPTAGGGIASYGHYLIYMGGEGVQYLAYNQTQCLDLNTGKWIQLSPMVKGLHASGAIVYKDAIYWAAGSFHRGGSNLNTLEKFNIKNGFTSMLNGENFDGWYKKIASGDEKIADKVFSLENGKTIHVFNNYFPDKYELSLKNNKTHGLIYTNKEYSSYILRFKYKWGNKIANNFQKWRYDAGVYFHVTNDKIWPDGLEYQISYDDVHQINHTGDVWYNKKFNVRNITDGDYHYLPESMGGKIGLAHYGKVYSLRNAPAHGLDNEWNNCEIIVMNNKYAIYKLNGRVINVLKDLPFKKGKIGFQSETAEIFYKDIEIKELKRNYPIETFLHEEKEKMNVLLLTGHTDHWHRWKIMASHIQMALDSAQCFNLDIDTIKNAQVDITNFKDYDAVIMNLNQVEWTKKSKTAFENYIKNGGGLVVLHEADNAFPKWTEYNKMIGLGGWGNRPKDKGYYFYRNDNKFIKDNTPGTVGKHGKRVPVEINVSDSLHPIMKGLPHKWIHYNDELYGDLRGPAENINVLAWAHSDKSSGGTGKDEPVIFTIKYGEGRIFHYVFGHTTDDFTKALDNKDFLIMLDRGTEWAATSNVIYSLRIGEHTFN